MFFAKGEIIMNNIYKVIWSKAKNCYVVASEIAKSHTKSASGSEKMGGYGKKALLALAAASAIFCGGLVNVGAVDTVHVDESGTPLTAHEVYTKDAVDTTFATKTEVNAKADSTTVTEQGTKITQLETAVGNTYTKAEADGKFATSDALNTAKTDLDGKITANTTKITDLSGRMTTAENNITDLKDADVRLEGKIDQNANDITGLKDKDTELSGKIDVNKAAIDQNKADITQNKNDITTINGKLTTAEGNIATNQNAIAELKTKVGTVNNGTYLDSSKTVGENLNKLNDGLVKEVADRKVADTALSGRITANANTIAEVNQQLVNTNNHFNTELRNTNAALQAEGKARAEADAKINTKIGNIDDTRTAYVKDANSISQNLTTLDEKLQDTNDRTGGIKRNTEDTQTTIENSVKVDKQGNVKDVNELSAKKITTTEDADLKGNVTLGTNAANTVTVNGTADFNEAVNMDKGLTVTNGETNLKKTTVDGDLKVTGTITTDKMVFGDPATNNYTEIDHGKVTSKNLVVNGAGQTISSSSTFDVEKNEVGFTNTATGDHSYYKQTAKGINGYVTDKDGNKTYTKVTATENSFQVQDKDGKNKNHQVNTKDSSVTEIKNGDGKTTKTEQTATDITNTAKDGTIKNEANHIENTATTMKTTVTGQATEDFNGGLNTKVTGAENHTVTGKQTNTVEGGQENIISGGQTNTITGDQTTTITGNKNETVTENVKEDYKKDLTTTVGGNETHEVKGTKTETVEGKVTENYKAGQATNVTGDQDITVSGTQTIKATDINRNASSGMIDTIDNAYGTNTETKEAGKTTTDVSIKGTGEKGQYIRGANESRDYLIKGTLKNSETKTAEVTSTEITDGTNKASTIQDAKNLAGSVTNGTETGISGIHANDDGSVSIDSAVAGGGMSSVINQKKDSIQSAVGDGTNSTVIYQDKDNVTIASSNGTVGIVGKDIVNNAQDTITNTAGTKITDKVGTNTRVIDSTSITDTVGTANRKIEDGKITDTAGDSTVTTENGKGTTFAKAGSAAYSTEAGATKDTNIAGNHITTGRVDANELGVSDKDDQGNTADLSVKAGEGIKSSATDKDGNTTYTKVTATENSFQVQDKDGKNKNHQVNTKDKSENTITNGDKTNTVTSTADGTTFNNSKANTAFEGGTYTDTTIKGNTITTGKVTMDYADVMKDLGVRGNANITGKTTTGSLEVTGTSTLKGEVTMESNATVKKDLKVEGTTTTQTLKVTENAEIDGTLKVAKKATFEDSVSIAKDLSVGGDVTANSYKVGDKTYIDANGIHANGQKITDVADGSISEGSKDAVNGGQLYGVKRDLEHQVDKVGANAAAMANLRPMEFDPSSKWNIAAAIGNYGSETAAALGAFYRPNDDVMVNLSTAFGTGENMVGGGVSVRLGKSGNKLSREENNALKAQVDDLTARMDALLSVLNPNMSKDFPDVPENHWAYEAVSRLAGNDIVQGYPDGEFHGERTMTRYEMAEIIYNALSRGAEAERELVEEFKPELQAMAASEKATAEKAEG